MIFLFSYFLCLKGENSTYLDISNPYNHQIIEFGNSSNQSLNNNKLKGCYDCHREQMDFLRSQNGFQFVESNCDFSNEAIWPKSQISGFELPHQPQPFENTSKTGKFNSNDFMNSELNSGAFLSKKSQEKIEENNETIENNNDQQQQQQQIEAFYASLVSRATSSSNLSFQNEFLNNFPFSVVNSSNNNPSTSLLKSETSSEMAENVLFLENELNKNPS